LKFRIEGGFDLVPFRFDLIHIEPLHPAAKCRPRDSRTDSSAPSCIRRLKIDPKTRRLVEAVDEEALTALGDEGVLAMICGQHERVFAR